MTHSRQVGYDEKKGAILADFLGLDVTDFDPSSAVFEWRAGEDAFVFHEDGRIVPAADRFSVRYYDRDGAQHERRLTYAEAETLSELFREGAL